MENLVQTAILNIPVANQLRVGGTQVDLLIGQFEEGCILLWLDAVRAELIEGFVFLLRAGGETRARLQRGGKKAEEQTSDSEPGVQAGPTPTTDTDHRPPTPTTDTDT